MSSGEKEPAEVADEFRRVCAPWVWGRETA
jgi:hypothetical protein